MKFYKLVLFILIMLFNISCDGYYGNDKNPFKVSEKCENDPYNYNKLDLVDESFGKIGVASNIKEYPRAGIDDLSFINNNKNLKIYGGFNSLCESSIINRVKIELYNNRGNKKTYYPYINKGYSGSFTQNVNFNKNNSDRCFFKDTNILLKTWASDEDGNTYYANRYFSSHKLNVKSEVPWKVNFAYHKRIDNKNKEIIRKIKYITKYKDEYDEIYKKTYRYRYEYTYDYEYTYADKYEYRFPIRVSIHADNDYMGEYFKIYINTIYDNSIKEYQISNTNRKASIPIGGNSKIKRGESYEIGVSLMEKLNNCNIQSKQIIQYVNIIEEELLNIKYNQLVNTKKTLLDTRKQYLGKF
jgi:hypothetical protein